MLLRLLLQVDLKLERFGFYTFLVGIVEAACGCRQKEVVLIYLSSIEKKFCIFCCGEVC